MSSNHDFVDQADALRKQMEEIEPNIEEEAEDIKASELPPRSEVHGKKEQSTKIRIRHPIVRLLAIAFILIVCLVATYNIWKDNMKLPESNENSSVASQTNIDVFEIKNNQPEIKDEFILPTPEHDKDENNLSTTSQEETGMDTDDEPIDAENTVVESNQEEPLKEIVQSPPSTEEFVIHKVKAGETLYRISMKYFKSRAGEEIIKQANQLDAKGTVFTGQQLKIPIKQSK